MKAWHTVLFDLDGTLTDSGEGIMKSAQYALEKFGIHEDDFNKLRLFVGPPLVEMFMELYGFSREQAKEAVSIYRERYEPIGLYENIPYPGIVNMLKQLKDQGITLAVATSKPEIFARRILDKFDMSQYFTAICGADLKGKHLDKAEMIQNAIKSLHLDLNHPNGILMVGDRKYDVEGALACRIPCIGVSFGYAQEGELERAGALAVAGSAEELTKIILDEALVDCFEVKK